MTYALVDKFDKIDVRTVSQTERAVKVNALVVFFGEAITRDHTDDQIDNLFQFHNPTWLYRIAEVDVTLKGDTPVLERKLTPLDILNWEVENYLMKHNLDHTSAIGMFGERLIKRFENEL